MRLILHVGPHKTGTTALQVGLRRKFSDAREGYPWFPNLDSGPGHHELAYSIATHGCNWELSNILKTAKYREISDIILSSEDFSKLTPKKIKYFIEVFDADEVLVIISLSPMIRKMYSIWQEQVKHGSIKSLSESLENILNAPGVNSELVENLSIELQAYKLSVIVSNAEHPGSIWRNFQDATGIDVSELAEQGDLHNRSLGLVSAEILRSLNVVLNAKRANIEIRSEATQMLGALLYSDAWHRLLEDDGVRLPTAWSCIAKELCVKNVRSIRQLRDRGLLTVYGQLSELVDFDRYFNE